MEVLQATRKVGRSSQQVSRPHGNWQKLPEDLAAKWKVDGGSSGCKKCCQKLMESLLATEKVNRIWQKFSRLRKIFTEVDERSLGCTEIWWKVSCPHGKLTEVIRSPGSGKLTEYDRRSPGHTKTWRKVSWVHRNLMEFDGWSPICIKYSRKVFWPHWKFTKVNRRSPYSTEIWR